MYQISVIIPVYNSLKYLRRCLDSVIHQTYRDFEIILVDDGSSDGCSEICDEYSQLDNRIKAIHKENGGAANARNTGVFVSGGRYVTFIDADDYVEFNYLETLYYLAESRSADISIVSLFVYDDNCADLTDLKETIYENGREAVEGIGAQHNYKFRSPCCKLIKREIVAEYLFPENLRSGEDFAVVYKWLFAASRVVDKNIPLYHYNRENTSSLTHSLSRANFDELLVGEMLDFFEKNGFDENLKIYSEEYIRRLAVYINEFSLLSDAVQYIPEMRKMLRVAIKKYGKKIGLKNNDQRNYIMRTAYPKTMMVTKKIKKAISVVKARI